MPMNPVSCITSRMSVKGPLRKWLHRPALTAHFTFLLAGSLVAAAASVAERDARNARLFMKSPDDVEVIGSCIFPGRPRPSQFLIRVPAGYPDTRPSP